ncbi:sulfotransferase family 2 domain-containing protein [Labrenzia sp. 011]|uniref:sulfotransferase family 2 domain-containing protein n=1 Tax=Labrenzia sp. 011 TaxID=2171494 RepID=UPI000D5150CB|nr:sulfotransferase family 2 domain-containing protein [Labrenzia sp. 011]PVB62271.1 hypothetical protein DCO57_08205 [Labrenzia sp. 011]
MSGFLKEKKLKLKKVAAKKWFFYNKNYDVKNFFNHDNVAVFPEIRLCFNRIKKSGNSSVCAYLAEVCGYPDYDSPEALKEHLLRPEHLSFRQLASLKSYHSLVVVREPFERALSAFLDKIAHDTSERFRQYEGYHDVSADGFSRFLKHLDEKGQQVNRHFWPQTDLLYKPLEDFSLVAKLENLSEVLPPFLETVCGRTIDRDHLSAPHEMEAQKAGNVTKAKNKLKYFYREESISLVRKIYRKDFEKLEYSEKFPV